MEVVAIVLTNRWDDEGTRFVPRSKSYLLYCSLADKLVCSHLGCNRHLQIRCTAASPFASKRFGRYTSPLCWRDAALAFYFTALCRGQRAFCSYPLPIVVEVIKMLQWCNNLTNSGLGTRSGFVFLFLDQTIHSSASKKVFAPMNL